MKWSEIEKQWMKDNYPNLSTKECADKLGRSVTSVKQYAEKILKIRKSPERSTAAQAENGGKNKIHFDLPPISDRTAYLKEYARKIRQDPSVRERHNANARKSRNTHRDKRNRICRENYAVLKHDVLVHYSTQIPSCACCKSTYEPFLELDHINGGGTKHAAEVGRGSVMYQWIKKNNYPSLFQILCHNCNKRKGTKPACDCPFDYSQPNNKKITEITVIATLSELPTPTWDL